MLWRAAVASLGAGTMAVGSGVLAGCKREPSAATPQPGDAGETTKLHALATIYAWADVIQQLGGARIEVEWVCENSQDPRDVRNTPEVRARVGAVDLVITSGFGDAWATENITDISAMERVLRPENTESGRKLVGTGAGPWLDTRVVREIAAQVRERLIGRDPSGERAYRANADTFAKELNALDDEAARTLAPLAGRTFLAIRPMWSAFAIRYGLVEKAVLNTQAQNLSDEDCRKLKDAAAKARTDVVVINAGLLPGIRQAVQAQVAPLRVLLLDPFGSSRAEARNSYAKLMRYNLQQLATLAGKA